MNKYGHFSQDGREFIITNPKTPRPWINFLSNNNYCALISHTGGGYSFVGEAGYNRILVEEPFSEILEDRPGRYIYIRDNQTNEFWAATWQPVCKDLDFWQARHGQGYTIIESEHQKIALKITYFVPRRHNLEFWQVEVENKSNKLRDISLFGFIEWGLASFVPELTDTSFFNLFNEVYFENNTILATKRRWERPDMAGAPWNKWAFFTANTKIDGFDCNKEEFIGRYRYLSNPIAVERGKTSNSQAKGRDSIGVLQKNLKLESGAKFKFHFILGTSSDKHKIPQLISEFLTINSVNEELAKLKRYWDDYLGKLKVQTPDQEFDLMINIWAKYQTWITSHWSEMDSYYIGGTGVFGFRDECQHLLGILPQEPEFAKKRTILLLEHQFAEGFVVHNWQPITNQGVVTHHSDDAQWLVMAVLNYLKETGNLSFLDEKVKYYDKGQGTVFEHLIKALDYTIKHSSPHGLPYRRTADWNDAITGGHRGKGESVMVAGLLAWNILELMPVLEIINEKQLVEKYQKIWQKIARSVNEYFWDGSWYIRATRDDGSKIGSNKNKEGKLHLDGQTWPIMSQIAPKDKALKAMDAVWENLDTPYGLCIFLPAYTKPDPGLGIISQFTPGSKENGTIFNHLNAWAVIAEIILDRPEKAFWLWKKTSPLTRGKNADLYKVEPYVYSEYIFGPQNADFGEGSFSWITGAAAWFYRAGTDWILGIKPTIEGLKIDPKIPKNWEGFQMLRHFRGAKFLILVKRDPAKSGKIFVNGRQILGNILPDFRRGSHRIEVYL